MGVGTAEMFVNAMHSLLSLGMMLNRWLVDIRRRSIDFCKKRENEDYN